MNGEDQESYKWERWGQDDGEDMSWAKGAAASQHPLIVIMTDCEGIVAGFSNFLREARATGDFVCLLLLLILNVKCSDFETLVSNFNI